ncbi:MAG: SCP2 sterol-binding domain-containing protein [Neomegalonema sp.]|nr:SCP2 sterol-binding domain-containing protein [Neomegalonema sp.]
MAEMDATLEGLTARITKAAAGKEGFGKVILLDLGDAGAIRIDGSGDATAVDNQPGAADVTIGLTPDNLAKLMTGKLSAPMAVMSGKISIKGDASLALKLAKFL